MSKGDGEGVEVDLELDLETVNRALLKVQAKFKTDLVSHAKQASPSSPPALPSFIAVLAWKSCGVSRVCSSLAIPPSLRCLQIAKPIQASTAVYSKAWDVVRKDKEIKVFYHS